VGIQKKYWSFGGENEFLRGVLELVVVRDASGVV